MTQLIQGKSGGMVAQVALRIPLEIRDWLKGYAAENGQSVNTALNAMLREKMARQEATAQK